MNFNDLCDRATILLVFQRLHAWLQNLDTIGVPELVDRAQANWTNIILRRSLEGVRPVGLRW
jgi:hypothetical protein